MLQIVVSFSLGSHVVGTVATRKANESVQSSSTTIVLTEGGAKIAKPLTQITKIASLKFAKVQQFLTHKIL